MTFLESAEDLQWLRDTIPAVKPWTFACAILEGNDYRPSRIILAERNHYRSIAVTLDYDKNEPLEYRASIGKLG